jgi:DNA-binding response OmpR family regulator
MMVLVVEDDRLVSWTLNASLSKWGFSVQTVFTGGDAIAQIERSGFDAILLDYKLPDLDGLEIAKQIREKKPGAVIFLLTASELHELPLISEGLIDGYFNKPLDLKQLHRALAGISHEKNASDAPTPV